jgi:hypothetical protein
MYGHSGIEDVYGNTVLQSTAAPWIPNTGTCNGTCFYVLKRAREL